MAASPDALRRRREAARKRYNDDPEYRAKVRAYQNAWRQAQRQNPEVRAKEAAKRDPEWARRHRLRKQFGLSAQDYEQMWDAQDGRCAICRRPENGRRLDVDHCHETGEVRGLLCNPCNQALGLLGEDTERIQAVLTYLEAK